jgi:hypothetical protein
MHSVARKGDGTCRRPTRPALHYLVRDFSAHAATVGKQGSGFRNRGLAGVTSLLRKGVARVS